MIRLLANKNRKKHKVTKIKTPTDLYGIQYRFDLGAKYFYIKCKINNINTHFYKELYHQHMITFNNCLEKNSHKNKIEHFLEELDNLITNMNENGYNSNYPIPIGSNNIILNGAHRLITSKVLNIKPTISKEDKNGYEYDYNFFLNRNKYSSQFVNLDKKYADFIALNNLELIKDTNKVRAIIIYPVANKLNKTNEIESILRKNGTIMYKKNIHLTEKGVKNLIIELYRGEKWIGGLFPKNDTNGKFKQCYVNYPIIYYMYSFNNPNQDINVKEKIRNLFNLKKNSIHITDFYDDTFRVSASLLNENSIKFLNNGTNILSEDIKSNLINYFNSVTNQDKVCIITDINKEIRYIKKNSSELDDIIYNPSKHFYLNGYKIATSDVISDLNSKIIGYDVADIKESIINLLNTKNIKSSLTEKVDNIIRNTNYDIGVIIIWNDKYKDIILETVKEKEIDIIYKKEIDNTNKFTENLLRQIHYKKTWWDRNIIEESSKRYNKKLTFYITYGKELHLNFKKIKNTIREENNFDKNIFHFSDPDCSKHIGKKCKCPTNRDDFLDEVYKHLNLLLNNNSLHFLYYSNFNKDLMFHQYFEEYCKYFKKNKLDSNNFLIDNGGVLSIYGLRDAHDLDFLTNINIKCNEKNVGCENKNHKEEYLKLGLSIDNIINDPNNYFYYFGKKILSIDILKKFKFNRTKIVGTGHKEIRQKDINDYNMILNQVR